MALLTVAELREHVETSPPDAALERILASAEQSIATSAGPLEVDEDGDVADEHAAWLPGRPWHLAPIAEIPIGELQPEDIERALAGMTTRRAYVAKQKPASPKTVRNVQVFLRRALGQAEQRGHITSNGAKLVPLRRVPRHHVDPLTPERARAILAAVKGDRYEAAYALAFCGLRAAEVLGLAWSDLDEGRTVATIRYQARGVRARGRAGSSSRPPPRSSRCHSPHS